MGFPFTRSCALALVVVACGLAAGPALASDEPSAPAAIAASDTTVELTWTWPANPVYPDQLDVIRNGVVVTNVPTSATSFLDTGLTPGDTYHYQLQTYSGSTPGPLIPATPVDVTTRGDLANPPTNVHASFGPGNIATVTWTRGASDADVVYQVTAQSSGGSPNVRTVRYAVDDPSPGSFTMDGFASYTSYTFTVRAIEDGGPTVAGDASASAMSLDTLAPQFNGGIVTAARGSLGTITASWSSATDAGTGVAGYSVCVDIASCTAEPVAPGLVQTADVGNGTIRNDGQSHSVAVFAVDGAGNQSAPISTSLFMPIPATPVITLSGGNGCAPLIASVKSSDAGTPKPTFHLFIVGANVETPIDQVIGGAPYQQLTLVANATFGADTSSASDPVTARVFDPDGPDVSPQVHGKADPSTNTETLSWLPVSAAGAPIIGYKVTSSTIPGLENGVFVEQSAAPQVRIPALEQSEQYIVQVTAVDGCLRESAPAQTRFRLDDNVPPTAPVLNAPVPGGRDVLLSWAPSSDNVAVDDYKIYQDGVFTGLRTSATQIDVAGLPDGFTAQYTVVATDTAGNQSAQSAPRSATTKDQTAPVWPRNRAVHRDGPGRHRHAQVARRDRQDRRQRVPVDARRTPDPEPRSDDLRRQERCRRQPSLRAACVRRGRERLDRQERGCDIGRPAQVDRGIGAPGREDDGQEDGERRRQAGDAHRPLVQAHADLRPRGAAAERDQEQGHGQGRDQGAHLAPRSNRQHRGGQAPRRAYRQEGHHLDPARQADQRHPPARRDRDGRHRDALGYRRRLEGADDRLRVVVVVAPRGARLLRRRARP